MSAFEVELIMVIASWRNSFRRQGSGVVSAEVRSSQDRLPDVLKPIVLASCLTRVTAAISSSTIRMGAEQLIFILP
jgi:hypothetical protein